MKRKLLITLIIILLIFISFTIIYIYQRKRDNNDKKGEYYIYELSAYKLDIDTSGSLDSETYKDSIITDDNLSINYQLYNPDESITGKIYIDDDKTLHITDENENLDYKVSNQKFKTMFVRDYKYVKGIYVLLIGEDSNVYLAQLTSNNIKDIIITNLYFKFKATNFTNLNFDADIFPTAIGTPILFENGYIYDVISGLRYNRNTKSIFDLVYVLEDGTITDRYGEVFSDLEGVHKIKYIVKTFTDDGMIELLIITQDNKILSYFDDNKFQVAEYTKKVKNVDMNVKAPFIKSQITITFEDDTKESYEAMCSTYYCPSKYES